MLIDIFGTSVTKHLPRSEGTSFQIFQILLRKKEYVSLRTAPSLFVTQTHTKI